MKYMAYFKNYHDVTENPLILGMFKVASKGSNALFNPNGLKINKPLVASAMPQADKNKKQLAASVLAQSGNQR